MKCNTFRLSWRPLSSMEKDFPGAFNTGSNQMGELQLSALTAASNTEAIRTKLLSLLSENVVSTILEF